MARAPFALIGGNEGSPGGIKAHQEFGHSRAQASWYPPAYYACDVPPHSSSLLAGYSLQPRER